MASITIRNPDDDVKTRLRVRAAAHRRPVLAGARQRRRRPGRNGGESVGLPPCRARTEPRPR